MDSDGRKGGGKGCGKFPERVNAQFSSMPATECIGAGRLEGWFATPAYIAETRGWGHIQSYCFEGDLFFHLQRSPWLRGINFQKKDEVTFEVIEVNGRCEAVKLLLPSQVADLEEKKQGGEAVDPNEPAPRDCIGQRVQGYTKSHHLLVAKQNWGFVASDSFSGQVFWHTTENPDMADVEFDRDDHVEFDVCLDEQRGSQVRAKNMKFICKNERPMVRPPQLSESKRKKKEQWLKNWSATPPPDWVCKFCGWQNFGRNKTCNFNDKNNQNCPGQRPPREEWPDVQNVKASEIPQEDELAQKALTQKWQAHLAWGKEEEVPVGWHTDGLHQQAAEDWGLGTAQSSGCLPPEPDGAGGRPKTPIPVPVLGADPTLLEAGLPGAIAAQQLKERKAAEEAALFMQQQALEAVLRQPQHVPRVVLPQEARLAAAAGGKALPFGGLSPSANIQAILALCLGAFNDLTVSRDPLATSTGKVATLVAEVNTVLGDDRSAKHTFAMQLAKHPWVLENGFEVRYQPGKNLICVTRPSEVAEQLAQGVKRKAPWE